MSESRNMPDTAHFFDQIDDVRLARPVLWSNPLLLDAHDGIALSGFTREDVEDAAARLERFRPFIARKFPETEGAGGLIESVLKPAPAMGSILLPPESGSLLFKLDSNLPISGSIKARGGIYEVLKKAEEIAASEGKLPREDDDYSVFDSPPMRKLLGSYGLVVGSTGNLGLSIGIMGAALGFKVTVHMSHDASQWKKELLRQQGVTVVEHSSDYSQAVAKGREEALATPGCHFVDDEDSRDLLLGYAVAGLRLGQQLEELGIVVDDEHPMSVYLPCGVGGGPGGVALGLKMAFGNAARCWFAEPVQAPAVLLGLATGKDERISGYDIGLNGLTAADGLAVNRPSGLVCRAMRHLVDGVFTVSDQELFKMLHMAAEYEGLKLEPSALAGFGGLDFVREHEIKNGLTPTATHIIWATGGGMVPAEEWHRYLMTGRVIADGHEEEGHETDEHEPDAGESAQ